MASPAVALPSLMTTILGTELGGMAAAATSSAAAMFVPLGSPANGVAASGVTGPGSAPKRTTATLWFPFAANALARKSAATGLASSATLRLSSTAKTTNCSFDGRR